MGFHVTDHFCFIGSTGCGKSTLAREINKLYPRSIIIDPVSDWDGDFIFTDFNNFADKLINLKNNNSKAFRIVLRFNSDQKNKKLILDQALRLAINYKNLQFITDEVQLFTGPHNLPHYLLESMTTGRHHGLSMVNISQSPSLLNKMLLKQSKHVFCGQLHERNDINTVSDFISVDRQELINLQKGYFLYFTPGQKIIKINSKK